MELSSRPYRSTSRRPKVQLIHVNDTSYALEYHVSIFLLLEPINDKPKEVMASNFITCKVAVIELNNSLYLHLHFIFYFSFIYFVVCYTTYYKVQYKIQVFELKVSKKCQVT